jgi:D-glycero-D-manno-heptose 1,7-bisphosphate phosphatase
MSTWRVQHPNRHDDRPARAVFLDRDGVVLVEKHYLSDPAGVELMPGAAAAMARLQRAGYLLIGISNQSGIGRGRFTLDDHAAVMTRLDEILASAGVAFDGFYFCPHAPGDGCACRKPAPGLLEEAARSFSWDPTASWLVGDKASDVELGLAAGLRAALVRTGHGLEYEDEFQQRWAGRDDAVLADDLGGVCDLILGRGPDDPAVDAEPGP